MNITELDSYNLADAVKFNDHLNPRLWGSDEHLRPEVREQLLRIAEDFRESLGIADLNLKDITISGSNAAYSYTPNSDIDLHLVVNVPDDEVYRELFDAKKFQYNEQHDIKIGDADVELYVQDSNEPHISQGVYSVLNNKWLQIPRRVKSVLDDTSTRHKFETVGHQIEQAVSSGNLKRISRLINKIKKMRQTGLEAHGEFGPENLAFKMLRTQGKIKELFDARTAAKDRELSLKEKAIPQPKKITWGFKQPRVLETAPTEEPAKQLPSDEEILQDFIRFCVEELKIKHMPTVKLRKDPQWSVRNRTFGRYTNDQHLLEVAWSGRHIMDVLRTVAHELTHKHQHERDGDRMDATAGETGSPWENEANARAGVLMRDYGRMHPKLFADGQAEDLKEANPNQQLSLYRPDGTTYRGEKMPVLNPNDFHSDTNPRKRVDQVTHQDLANRTAPDLVDPIERTERKIDMDRLKNVIRANMKDLLSTETAVLNMRYWKDLTLEQTAQALGLTPERVRQIEAKALRKLRHFSKSDQLKPFVEPRLTWPGIKEAVGYIPTAAEKNDPRFSMALTQDIRPGQLGKEANKLKLKTDSQGHPQVARPDGLFEKLALELAQFKRTPVAESVAQLAEVRMSPSNLMQWATSKDAQGIRAGFEAELIFRDTQRNDDDDYEMEPDYDADERCRSLGQVVDFFEGGDADGNYGLGSRQAERLREQLDEAYYEWYDEQMHRDFKEEAEDLIRKVIVDEGDWDEDNEIQKQLELLDLTNDEMNDIIRAGERAPKFTSSKEQILYAEANPLYQKYLDAQEEAEGLLDDLVADEVRKQGGIWDAALEDFRNNYSLDDDSGFFDDAGLRWMSDVASEYDLDWPYMTGGNSGTGSRSWDSIGDSLNDVVDMPVKVSSGYHNATRREGQWIVEPDSSLQPDDSDDMGLEIVSPPMPLLVALNKLQQVTDWANNNEGNAYTNSSTGLHMGVSVPFKGGDVDYLKLILFLGDEYVLKQFGREANTYTKSAMSKFRENIRGGRADPAGAMKLMQSGLIELAHREIQKGVGDGKYTSAHIQKGYIEFRSAGGDWLAEENANPEILQTTMLRYARAMSLAANPSEERREYAKKLYKLVAPEGDSELALFSQYAAGELTAEQLKKRWAEKQLEAEPKGDWKLWNAHNGVAVPGEEFHGYTKSDAWERAKKGIRPGASMEDFQLAYKLLPMKSQTGDWEVYNTETGETLEVLHGFATKGEAADSVYDKYAEQGIGFNVRPADPEAPEKPLTPRAKLAKRITTKKPEPKQVANQATNERGVPYWEVYEIENEHVVHTFLSDTATDAKVDGANWLTSIGAEYPDLFAVRPKIKNIQVKDIAPDVAQNFAGDYSAFERNSDRIDAIRQDATQRSGSWSIYDVTLGREISRMNDVPWSQADARADELEQSTGHNMSVRGLSDLEEGQHQHTEVIKRQIGNWLVYLDNHSVIRAMTRNIGPRMMTDLLSQLNAIPNLETQVPIGGTFWIQDNKTKSSFFFKRLDIPSEPLAVRCETGVKDDPRAGRNTPVFRVNAYTGPETPKDIQGMKQAKLISRFVGPNVMATNLAANIQKGHLNSGDAIRNPATQDSKRYDTAFKQAQQMDKEVDESLPAKNLNQLYKIKQQLAHPALGTTPPEPAPRAEPVRPTQPRVSAALADLERQRAKLNKIMDLKQELETLTARAGRTRYGITPGLAADIEDIYPEPKSEADMDAMLQGYEIQKKKLTDYIARQRKVFPKESVAEGEVVPFRRPQAQPLLPQDVLHLANEWFWANDDTNTLQAVTDQGYGQGAENLVKYIQAQLQSKGWTIDFDDEIDNIVLTNRSGQTVALPVSDAYDGTGWATGTLSENFEDGRGPGRPGDSQRHGIPKGATMAELEKAAKAPGRKGQLARWQLNMRRGKKK